MKRWEYRIEWDNAFHPIGEKELNAFGAQGWELVQVIEVEREISFYLKRPLPAPKRQPGVIMISAA